MGGGAGGTGGGKARGAQALRRPATHGPRRSAPDSGVGVRAGGVANGSKVTTAQRSTAQMDLCGPHLGAEARKGVGVCRRGYCRETRRGKGQGGGACLGAGARKGVGQGLPRAAGRRGDAAVLRRAPRAALVGAAQPLGSLQEACSNCNRVKSGGLLRLQSGCNRVKSLGCERGGGGGGAEAQVPLSRCTPCRARAP